MVRVFSGIYRFNFLKKKAWTGSTVHGLGAQHRFIGSAHGFIKPEPLVDGSRVRNKSMKGYLRILIEAVGSDMDGWCPPVGWQRCGQDARWRHCHLSPELWSSVYMALGRKWSGEGAHRYWGFGGHGETMARSRDGGFLLGSMACGEDDVLVILWSTQGWGGTRGPWRCFLSWWRSSSGVGVACWWRRGGE
jgi:hypothetical protein